MLRMVKLSNVKKSSTRFSIDKYDVSGYLSDLTPWGIFVPTKIYDSIIDRHHYIFYVKNYRQHNEIAVEFFEDSP